MAPTEACSLELPVHGAQLFPNAITSHELSLLEECLASLPSQPGVRITRNSKLRDWVVARSAVGRIAQSILGSSAQPVRAILFDKSKDSNWALGWHQDRTIAVRDRGNVEGFVNWTVKDGITHVEPPFDIIKRMLTVRVHLDEVNESNAPLLICTASHRLGRVKESEINAAVEASEIISCLAERGDMWAYCTAILHASEASRHPRARRVLQVDFSADSLPGGLEWAGLD